MLPKLREENAKAKSGKAGKRKGWKDVVVEGMPAPAILKVRSEVQVLTADYGHVCAQMTLKSRSS